MTQHSLTKLRVVAGWMSLSLSITGLAQIPGDVKAHSVDLTKLLSGKNACNGAAQFIQEDEIAMLVGADSDCYKAVDSIELMILSVQGRIISRKPWPSSFPIVSLADGRLAVAGVGEFYVMNAKLETIQTVVPPHVERSSLSLQKTGIPGSVRAKFPRGEAFTYAGIPLQQVRNTEPLAGDIFITTGDRGQTLVLNGRQLQVTQPNGTKTSLADLKWLFNCDKNCQAYDAGTGWSISNGPNKRIAFMSNGSKFPVTDDAGLFPFFRVFVIDLETGKEVFRKQFITKTARRSAQISPRGDQLLLSDGVELNFQPLH
jgi:hypothetical protein